MSKIVVTSVGYLGDIAPYVEPARRLAAAGHAIRESDGAQALVDTTLAVLAGGQPQDQYPC